MNHSASFPKKQQPILTTMSTQDCMPSAFAHFEQQVFVPNGYSLTEGGLYQTVKNEQGKPNEILLSHTPIGIAARSRDHSNSSWAVRIMWLDSDGETRTRTIPASQLTHSREFQSLSKELANAGVLLAPSARLQAALLAYFFECLRHPSLPLERTVDQLGFYAYGQSSLAFVLPQEILQACPNSNNEALHFRAKNPVPAHHAYHSKGNLEGWKNSIQPFSDNPLIVTSTLFGLMGPFLSLLEEENCGVHFYGSTSCGKTTAAQVCASTTGFPGNPSRGNRQPSLFQTWNTTKNAVEQLLAPHSGMTVIIDEVGANDAGINLYNAFSGLGKAKLNEESVLREQNSWSAFVLSTGEYSCNLHANLKNPGQITAGSMVRMMDLPIDFLHQKAQDLGAPELPDMETLSHQVEQLQQDILNHYGCALPALVASLFESPIENGVDLATSIKTHFDAIHESLCENLQESGAILISPQRRALRRLSLAFVVGSLAIERGIIPFSEEQITTAILAAAHAWIGETQFTPVEDQIENSLIDYCITHSNLLKTDFRTQDSSRSSNLPFFYDAEKKLLFFSKSQMLVATGQRDARTVTQALSRKDYWHYSKGEKRADPKVPSHVKEHLSDSRCYILYADVLLQNAIPSLENVPRPLDEQNPMQKAFPFGF